MGFVQISFELYSDNKNEASVALGFIAYLSSEGAFYNTEMRQCVNICE